MVYNERDVRNEHVIECAKQMMTAARTAPKAKGVDIIEVMMITGEDIMTLSNTLHQIGEDMGRGGLMRDADNIQSAEAVILIGSREEAMCLNCGYCGAPTCGERKPGVPCAMLIEKYPHKERRSAQKTQAVIVFLKLKFDCHILFAEDLVSNFLRDDRFCKKTRPRILFS